MIVINPAALVIIMISRTGGLVDMIAYHSNLLGPNIANHTN